MRPDGIVGSPVGFKSFYGVLLEPTSILAIAAQSFTFPVFDPASVFRAPVIGAYIPMRFAGKAYVSLRSVDGDGHQDQSVPSASAARTIVEAVDGGTGTRQQNALRPKILTFFVDRAPFLRFDAPGFVPQPNQSFVDRTLSLHLLAGDADPFDPGSPPPPGGPSPATVLRWNLTLTGKDGNGNPVSHSPLPGPVFTPDIQVTVPAEFVDPRVTIHVELCDCALCENLPGSGRCAGFSIPVLVAPGEVVGVDPPNGRDLSLEGVRPNPSDGSGVEVHFSLATGVAARLELLDVAGRRWALQNLGAPGTGPHVVRLAPRDRLPAGVYLVKLTQGGHVRVARVAVLE